MPKRSGSIFVTLGAVLMLSALLLFFYNKYEEYRAGQEAELLLHDIHSQIIKDTNQAMTTDESEREGWENLSGEMTVLEIDGNEYIGYISIPDLELELPVMSEWDYKRLKIAPCRHFGSTKTDDLVIAAHNYKSHFGSLSSLEIGAKVKFTDMDGMENLYVMKKKPETLEPEAVDAVLNSGYDLVLYTCTPGGLTRIAAFFDRVIDGGEE